MGPEAESEEKCPYCNRRAYRVAARERPGLEAYLCYACGGCMIFEVTAPHIAPKPR